MLTAHLRADTFAGKFAGQKMDLISLNLERFCPLHELPESALKAGFRAGARGTHTSRTMMFDDLSSVLAATDPSAVRADYGLAITEANCLGKATASTRRLSSQRLAELYALDPAVPLFRVFRRLWDIDRDGRRLLALLCAIARDPLLAATAGPVVSLTPDAEFSRESTKQAVRQLVGDRLNDATLDKVVRNAASSWTQSGHLEGRTFKKRRPVRATATTAALGLYLSYVAGFRGNDIFASGWFTVLDCGPTAARELATEAKRIGLIDLRMAGDVVDINLDRLDPLSHGE